MDSHKRRSQTRRRQRSKLKLSPRNRAPLICAAKVVAVGCERPEVGSARGVDSALLADNKPLQTSFSPDSVDGTSEIDPQGGAVGWWLQRQRRAERKRICAKHAK